MREREKTEFYGVFIINKEGIIAKPIPNSLVIINMAMEKYVSLLLSISFNSCFFRAYIVNIVPKWP